MTSKRACIAAALTFSLIFATYWLSALALERDSSPRDAYFNLLADAFLHGRLFLVDPPLKDDLTQHAGQWYVPFPPLPALLLLPLVSAFGLAQVNTVLFGAAIGATNVALAFLLLDALAARGWTQLRLGDNLWLTALFGLGSVHWYMSTMGTVWFLAQICTATFMLASLWLALATRAPVLSGIALAVAMLGRPHVALMLPLLLAIELQHRGGPVGGWRSWAMWAIGTLAPLAVGAALLLAYNVARFGSPLDFGYTNQNVSPDLITDLHAHGQFSLYYLPHNLWAMLLAGPVWDGERRMFMPTVEGMSLLFTTPALVMLGLARRPQTLVLGAWIGLGLLLIPLLTYYNTGWWQFGYRFSLDFMPLALVLLALAAGQRVGWPMRILILLGVLANAGGTWWFFNPRYFL